MKKIIIIGAGGNSKVIIDIIKERKRVFGENLEILGLLDDDSKKDELLGYKVLGPIDKVLTYELGEGIYFINGIGANNVRKKISQKYPKLSYYTAIHPSAIIGSAVQIDEGSMLMAGAIINADSIIGKCAIINTGAIIEHDNLIGDFVHIASGTITGGNVKIGNCSMVGSGAKIIPGINIGDNCIVGAGSVVIADLPKNSTAVGVPARIVK